MVLLESDVKELADAHVYLDSKNPKAPQALDLLLGTQGWRRFAFMDSVAFLRKHGVRARKVLALKLSTRNERDKGFRFRGGVNNLDFKEVKKVQKPAPAAPQAKPGKGAQLGRAAGASIQFLGKEGNYGQLRLRSGEMRRVLLDCRATLGEVGNAEHSLRKLGKAGAKRWRGIRPTVRGVAMNPVDHPHGGGEGRTSGGRHPVSPWGVPTKGYRTRHNKRSDSMIIRRRSR